MSSTTNYLVDTDIVIYWLTNKYPCLQQRIETIGADRIWLSAITIAELYFGAGNSARPFENCGLLDELLVEIQVIPFTERTGLVFGRIKAALKKKGEILNDSDLFIAATAISRNLTLVTNNVRHFQRIAELRIEQWI